MTKTYLGAEQMSDYFWVQVDDWTSGPMPAELCSGGWYIIGSEYPIDRKRISVLGPLNAPIAFEQFTADQLNELRDVALRVAQPRLP